MHFSHTMCQLILSLIVVLSLSWKTEVGILSKILVCQSWSVSLGHSLIAEVECIQLFDSIIAQIPTQDIK